MAMNACEHKFSRNVSFQCTGVSFPCKYLRTARLEFQGADGTTGFIWVNRSLPRHAAIPAPVNRHRSRVVQPLLADYPSHLKF
jgi:hypothetical protein